ncbi:MAG: SOS response-associated peptidase family protein, partial [Methylococcales bacterium]
LFYTAGLWNQWQSPDGETIDSCTIITTRPNNTLADIHHRMPVILNHSDFDTWLDADFEQAKDLLQPSTQPMDKYPVNPKVVNNARNNTVNCLERWSGEG